MRSSLWLSGALKFSRILTDITDSAVVDFPHLFCAISSVCTIAYYNVQCCVVDFDVLTSTLQNNPVI